MPRSRLKIHSLLLAGLLTVFLYADKSLLAREGPPDSLAWELISPGRERASLQGLWHVIQKKGAIENFRVPGVLPDGRKAILQRRFYLDARLRDKTLLLVADGVNYSSKISINDRPVASHAGGYTTFDAVLDTAGLAYGEENILQLEIDGELSAHNSVPPRHRPLGWRHRAGILWDIRLEAIPNLAIENVQAIPQFGAANDAIDLSVQVAIRAFRNAQSVASDSAAYSLAAELTEIDGRQVLAAAKPVKLALTEDVLSKQNLQLQLKGLTRWEPQHPVLYRLRVVLDRNGAAYDAVTTAIGLRQIEIRNGRFFLNGAPFFMKGVDWMDDFSGLSGDSLAAAVDLVIRQIKSIGANTVRSVGRALHPLFVERCSSEGIFVLQELPLYFMNGKQLANEQVLRLAERDLTEMILRDRMQPSVLAWGLATNLEETAPSAAPAVNGLAQQASMLDSRPLYLVSRTPQLLPRTARVDFALYDLFEQTNLAYPAMRDGSILIAPVVGYFVQPQRVAISFVEPERKRIEAEEIQAQQIETALAYFQKSWPVYPGVFIHALADWRGDMPSVVTGASKDPFLRPAGLIREDRQPRIAFRMVLAYFEGDRKPPISPNQTQPIQPYIFPIAGLGVLFVFIFFLNRDKRLRGHLRRIFAHPHGFYTDLRENRKVPAFLSVLLGVLEGVIWGTIITGAMFALRESVRFDEILSLLLPNPKVKMLIIWFIWHPGWGILFFALAYLILMLVLAFLLRILALFFGEAPPQIQFVSLVFWTASCFLPLAVIAPILHRVILQTSYAKLALGAIALCLLWYLIRTYRGMRVIYLLPPGRAAVLFVIFVGIISGAVLIYYQQTQAILDYFSYYKSYIF